MNPDLEGASIMIVDDTPANLELLAEMLHAKGYRVLQFPNGMTALHACVRVKPDLILLDIMMPQMDGFEVNRRLKTDEKLRDIPVIFISALDDTANIVQALSQGGVDYITKPFKEEEVLARVRTHLKIVFLQRQLKAHNENLEELVAKRTQQLTRAHERLKELDRLKDDFLSMISHEIRTPANGLLGVGELLIELCPPSENARNYEEMFRECSSRLRKLIDDASLLGDIDRLIEDTDIDVSFSDLLQEIRESFPEVRITVETQVDPEKVFFKADPVLLKKAFETTLLLARKFSSKKKPVSLLGLAGEQHLSVQIPIDLLYLTHEQAETFFNIESTFRASSQAESMGLAPVVAHKILSAFGGGLNLVKQEGTKGYVEAIMLTQERIT
ncbi:MAG TPA: response regulator [Thermotogota bacterium]|jgi:DNA-binding response OmpR family regulator|nr:response regulator [Thermotogota bacterium]NLH19700.1 response regulator [Thermotogaceae bacterium]OQC31483.1 MAG: Response regulator PleD [Thermotogota bacterium ADurb.Bin062]HNW46587.1 response regulator [Thermotogota bacterium]HNY81758.1 response regulator [Thermotogota bacterium]